MWMSLDLFLRVYCVCICIYTSMDIRAYAPGFIIKYDIFQKIKIKKIIDANIIKYI